MAATELPVLTTEQSRTLLRITAQRVRAAVRRQNETLALPANMAEIPLFGAFVSLKTCDGNQLRSCMGTLRGAEPLGRLLEQAAILAATADPRFPPLRSTELDSLNMEVWLLACPRPVLAVGRDRIDAVQIGKHGLIVSRGSRHGLLLPGVPVEFGWNARTFLEHVCLKAGLPPDAWKDEKTQFELFEGVNFSGNLATLLREADAPDTLPGNPTDTTEMDPVRLGFGEIVVSPEIPPVSPMVRTPVRVRHAAVAGRFYPVGRQMTEMLDRFFLDAEKSADTLRSILPEEPFLGAMVPHAGWIFSGELMVRTLSLLRERPPLTRRWLILCPKHTPGGAPWAVADYDEWEIPGENGRPVRIPADRELA
ncbi:MAG: AmmeMemoRadiSam system protein A, partial [Planctomycetia bacterium]|nr:AmmeMemoRadiSam system protein A [Planctomycetia bacterium]